MTEKEKAAPQNGTTPITKGNITTLLTKEATKLELVALHLLANGTQGISALSALASLHDLNSRNSISELRRHHGITIKDEYFSHQYNRGETVPMKRYWLAGRSEARKMAELVNLKRKQRGATPLSQQQMARYLVAFPLPATTPAHSHQPAA
ncbi:hypothetical protein [Aeromonas caviae]|uniref:hypothetical protein n=1 Tax=Aeromonas caviae TaxID=648 RepID=UPI002B250217|nr:hypothetical protein [Aeromonas caviae]MEA9428255.1 hypothetical protein [Aeromonas caviae]MEA9433642.1 hypothetical protein [Aeromonas caviae]